MKSKGFTLVELLAVISILSLLSLITSTVISNSLKEAKKDLTETQKESIKLAAKAWGSDNISKLPTGNNCGYITLKDLIDDGYLESKIINPETKEEISSDLKIKISSQQSKKNLIYEVNSSSINDCSYIGQTIHIDLPKGLTPVVYDEGKNLWRVPNASEEWYNYDEQKWANAVVLGKGKTKKAGEIVKVEGDKPDALMMLVWIPRFEYKIEGQYGKGGQSADLPGEIEVNFVSRTKKGYDETTGYRVHPAFTFGDQDVSGFWVGKFELSHETLSANTTDNNLECSTTNCINASGLRILPNKASLRYNNVSNFWYGIKSIENTNLFGLTNMDTHMMKNSEWGAVAYLSQSKYGKYGNNDYKDEQKEVYINNSINFYTGRSGGNPGGNTKIKDTYTNETSTNQNSSYGFYTYDGYLIDYSTGNKTEARDINKGTGASTTGNIYGVYDMSGGSWEYVMGAYGPEYPTISSSGFASDVFTLSTIEPKYYDIYKMDNASTACDNNGPCLGHAISETTGWYKDTILMVTSESSWFMRGGSHGSNIGAGIFNYINSDGKNYYDHSARFVGIIK